MVPLVRGISKSEFLRGKQCPLALWFYRHRKDIYTPPREEVQKNLTFGTTIGERARQLFLEGKLVDTPPWNTSLSIIRTKNLIAEGARILFEACAEHPLDHSHARIDILSMNSDNRWILYEVKAASEVLPHHLDDLAFQWRVFKAAGYDLASAYIIHLKKQIPADTPVTNVSGIFTRVDVTSPIISMQQSITKTNFELFAVIRNHTPPSCPPGPHCVHPFLCPYSEYCWKSLTEEEQTALLNTTSPSDPTSSS